MLLLSQSISNLRDRPRYYWNLRNARALHPASRSAYNRPMEKVVRRHSLKTQPRDTEYWLSRPIAERLDAVELLRRAWLETHPDAVQGLQRVCHVIKRKRG